MKKAFIVLAVLVVGGIGFFVWKAKKAQAQPAEAKDKVVKVERGPIQLSVSCTGRVVSNLDVEIKCKASGEVVKLPFDVSDRVKKGDLVAELDPIDEERRVKQSTVEYQVSEAKLEQAKLNLEVAEMNLKTERIRADAALESAKAQAADAAAKAERVKALLEKKLAAQEDYDTARTASVQAQATLQNAQAQVDDLKTQETALELRQQDVKLAQSQVESDEINLELTKQQLTNTKVFAPIAGVVTARDVQIGQIVASGVSNVGGGTAILTISDLSQIFVLASVDESDIGKVGVGQESTITADAFPGVVFPGKVVRIATVGVNTSNVITFEVKIEVLGHQKNLLKPQMTANVDIIAAEAKNALLVPADAVGRDGDKRMVLLQKADGTTELHPVEVGITDGVDIQVVKGLSEGDQVVEGAGMGDNRWRNGDSPGGPGGRGRNSAYRMTRMMMRGGRH